MTSNTRMAGHNKSFQAPLDNASIADLSKRNMFVNFTSELGPDIRNNKRTSHNDHRKLSSKKMIPVLPVPDPSSRGKATETIDS